MTRALLWACALLLAANLTRGGAQAFGNDAARIASALEKIASELPRIRQAQESNARHCAQRP